MGRTFRWIAVAGWIAWGLAAPGAVADVEAVNAETPWRAYLVHGPNLLREDGALKVQQRHRTAAFDPAAPDDDKNRFTRMPPANWPKADFDDTCWARYTPDDLLDYMGDYGIAIFGRAWPALLCIRTAFGVADPAKAADVKVEVTCLGGGVVYVNGREVGRGFLPPGALAPLAPAQDYPVEAYTTDDGATALPVLQSTSEPDPKWLGRYRKRVRTFSVRVPGDMLVKGRNVLAVELHRSAVAGPLGRRGGWSHLGIHRVALTGRRDGGLIPYAEAARGVRVWSAAAEEQVTDSPPEQSLIRRSMFKTFIWARGMPVKGIRMGNPFDPVRPVRMATPRNGVCSGQVVLSDPAGLADVTAAVGPLQGPSGAVIPAAGVKIRYAVRHAAVHYCDALMPDPPKGAKTVPVWAIVEVPADQAFGWYTGRLSLSAGGKAFSVGVQVLVTGHVLPDARDFTSDIGVMHSPDTIARHYKVQPWSDAHFCLLEPSLALMGQLGNDGLHVQVITRNQFNWRTPLVRFVKTPDGLRPDFTVLRKYVAAYARHCAAPKVFCLYIWDANCAKRVANVYEGRQIPSRAFTPRMPLMVEAVDPANGTVSEVEAPRIGDEGSEGFYRALIDGARQIVEQRRWAVRSIMLGLGGDNRPSQEAAALMKQWAPCARWDLLSHFSGDPGALFYRGPLLAQLKAGKLIAVGGLEVGLKEHPWTAEARVLTALQIEQRLANPTEFIEFGTARWLWQDYSPPFVFRTLPLLWGNLGRIGLDFWETARDAPRNKSYFTQSSSLTVAGPKGAVPTVRFQMMREGVQDMEVRLAVIRAYDKLPAEKRPPYRALLDELIRRMDGGRYFLSQHELGYDWPSYAARVQEAAAELAGVHSHATWQRPPK